MALWFPVYVNDKRIATIDIVRDDQPGTDPDDYNKYKWTVRRHSDTVMSAEGEIHHRYGDGWNVLVQLVMDSYQHAIR